MIIIQPIFILIMQKVPYHRQTYNTLRKLPPSCHGTCLLIRIDQRGKYTVWIGQEIFWRVVLDDSTLTQGQYGVRVQDGGHAML